MLTNSMASRKRITSLKLKNEEGVSRPRQKTSFSFNLEVNTPNKRGHYPIYLRVTENRKHKRYLSSIELSRKIDWNSSAQEIRTTEPNAKKWNDELQKLIERAKDIYRDLDEDGIATAEKSLRFLREAKNLTPSIY